MEKIEKKLLYTTAKSRFNVRNGRKQYKYSEIKKKIFSPIIAVSAVAIMFNKKYEHLPEL